MTKFIDLIYCADLNGLHIIACAPMDAYISKGDIVRVDEMKGLYLVSCKVTVAKDSDTYKFITEALGEKCDGLHKVTGRYSHKEIEDSDYE